MTERFKFCPFCGKPGIKTYYVEIMPVHREMPKYGCEPCNVFFHRLEDWDRRAFGAEEKR